MEPIPVSGPTVEEGSAPDRETRRPMSFWDRSKVFFLFVGVWTLLVWNRKAGDPNMTWSDALVLTLRHAGFWLVLAGLELFRQAHYLMSEYSAGWHHFWSERVFGGWGRFTARMNDWNRYRIGRFVKFLLFLGVLAYVLGEIFDLSPVVALFELPLILWQMLPLILQLLFFMLAMILQFVALFWFLSRGGVEVYMPEDIKTRFTDVWGQDPVVERVKENMVFLEDPESIEERGGYVPGGILLWGPPGTGKTLLAEAVAGETGKPFVFVEPGAFTQMFIGVGILKVKALFRKLRKLAVRYGGVIAFFDEADSLGNRGALGGFNPQGAGWASDVFASAPRCHGLAYARDETIAVLQRHAMSPAAGGAPAPGGVRKIIMGMGGGGGGMGTLQALLAELSGMKKPRGFFNRVVRRVLGMRPKPPPKYRMLVMMASNMPEALDEALLRPGRIDRIYKVGYPSKEGRKRTYEGYFSKVAHDLTAEQIDRLATITPYATGAIIKDLVNESLVVAIRDGRDVITWPDVIKARLLKTLGPGQDVEYIERERHAIAIHEACHAVAQYHLQKHMGIDVATIEMGQGYLGMVKPIPLEEQFTSWRTEYEADIKVFLASLAGERMFFDGDNSSGVSGDLQSATTIAMYMDGFWGMGSTVGSHAAVKERIGSYPIIDGTSRNLLETELGSRIEERLAELYDEVAELLETHRDQVLAVAHALEAHKTITGEDVEAVIRGTQGPLVDGRAYHQSDFVEVAEEYHDHAVAAHRDKAGVPVALPRIAPEVIPGAAFAPPDD